MSLAELEGPDLARACEILDRAAHDVAKYMAMTARNVDLEPPGEDLLGRLRSELLAVDGSRSAWELWAGFARQLELLARDPEVEAVTGAMAELRRLAGTDGVDARALARLTVETSGRIAALRDAARRRRSERAR